MIQGLLLPDKRSLKEDDKIVEFYKFTMCQKLQKKRASDAKEQSLKILFFLWSVGPIFPRPLSKYFSDTPTRWLKLLGVVLEKIAVTVNDLRDSFNK